jgi:hypothetical protein
MAFRADALPPTPRSDRLRGKTDPLPDTLVGYGQFAGKNRRKPANLRISMPLPLHYAPFPSSLAIPIYNNFQLSFADSKPLPVLTRRFLPVAMLPLS